MSTHYLPKSPTTSSPPSPHHQHQYHQQQHSKYSTPSSPVYPPQASSSSRRSSVCLPPPPQQSTGVGVTQHRRTRSFRESPRRPTSPRSAIPMTSFEFENTIKPQVSSSSSSPVVLPPKKRQIVRPPPLNCFTSSTTERSSTTSSASTATTAFFNTSTESSGSTSRYTRNKTNPSTPSSASNWSMSSEYSTTSSISKRESRDRIAAAGGKLAYLASRRGSSGSVCSSSACSTPPNTPGGSGGGGGGGGGSSGTPGSTTTVPYTRVAGGRRQSSGNFLEVPSTTSIATADQGQQGQRTPATSPTQSSRPRVNSLPATSLLSPQLLSPTYVPSSYHQHSQNRTPYNPRSTITKSQDYLYRLRTFNITKGGDVVNCGDTIVRRSKSNNCITDNGSTSPRKYSLNTSPTRSQRSSPCRRGSLSPRLVIMSPLLDPSCCVAKEMMTGSEEDEDEEFDEEELTMREFVGLELPQEALVKYRVVLLGESGVGKSALVRQFMTSEYINTYDMSLDEEYGEREVSVLLDSKESQLVFIDHPCIEMSVENSLATYEPHACVVVYSVTDRRSFEFAGEVLRYLWQEGTTHERSVILVGNKCDLARARVISSQEGKQLATSHDTKFIETSSGIQHNVDELLVGVLKQIRLREAANVPEGVATNNNRCSSKERTRTHQQGGTTPRGSIMGLLFTRELINKLCFLSNKAKSCENLHVL